MVRWFGLWVQAETARWATGQHVAELWTWKRLDEPKAHPQQPQQVLRSAIVGRLRRYSRQVLAPVRRALSSVRRCGADIYGRLLECVALSLPLRC
jgi:hypothetical protein